MVKRVGDFKLTNYVPRVLKVTGVVRLNSSILGAEIIGNVLRARFNLILKSNRLVTRK